MGSKSLLVDEDAMSIIRFDSRSDLDEPAEEARKEVRALNVEEAIPLNSAVLSENMETAFESSVPVWVRQNIISLGEKFGVHSQGCDEVAEELYMKIDGKRQCFSEELKALIAVTPKEKGSKELKRLESGNNFFSY